MIDQDRPEADDRFRDLVDAYCDDLIDEAGVAELEAALRAGEPARRYFASYFRLHAELDFAARAGRAAGRALDRAGAAGRMARPSRRPIPKRGLAAAAALVASAGFALGAWGWSARSKAQPRNVAWLVNAQDCRWAGLAETPGRDMAEGKVLRLDRGLAEVEFDRGARVILQGPATLELLSGNMARLVSGSISAKVPPPGPRVHGAFPAGQGGRPRDRVRPLRRGRVDRGPGLLGRADRRGGRPVGPRRPPGRGPGGVDRRPARGGPARCRGRRRCRPPPVRPGDRPAPEDRRPGGASARLRLARPRDDPRRRGPGRGPAPPACPGPARPCPLPTPTSGSCPTPPGSN